MPFLFRQRTGRGAGHGALKGQAVFLLLLALFTLHCAPSFLRRSVPADVTPERILEQVTQNMAGLHEFEGKVRIVVETEDGRETATAKVLYRKPQLVKIEVKGPLGLTVATIQVQHDTMRVYYPLSKYCVTGRPGAEHIELMTGIRLDMADFQSFLLGDENLAAEAAAHLADFCVDGRQYRFRFAWDRVGQTHWVDPWLLVLTRSEFYDDRQVLQLRQTYRNYRKFGGTRLPTRVEQERRNIGQRLQMQLIEAEVNGGIRDDRFELHLPSDIEYIDLFQ